jgi:HAD superfamily hydrolase (TIGR01662 family)
MDVLEQYMNEMYRQPEGAIVDTKYKLILFDLDGTLAPFDSDQLFPDAAAWLDANQDQNVTIVTNQGGIGLRYWMSVAGFGEPEKYPTEDMFNARLNRTFSKSRFFPAVLMCFRYQSKSSGKWCPIPPGAEGLNEWSMTWRKPEPGMLLYAMSLVGATPADTLMIGDGEEDIQAAENAGCAFQWAWQFFGRPMPETEG